MPRCKLRVSGFAVTDSARFCDGGFDSFLGFEYVVLITLASHVFEYFLRFLLQACVICAFWLCWGSHAVTPLLLAYPHVFLPCGPFIGFLGFFYVGLGYSCVGVDRHDDYSADSSASLAQCGFVGGFLPNFAIFVLVSDHLRNFLLFFLGFPLAGPNDFYLPTPPAYSPLSLSPLVSSLGGQRCSPPSLVASVMFALGEFLSVAAVLYLLFLLLLRVLSALAEPP